MTSGATLNLLLTFYVHYRRSHHWSRVFLRRLLRRRLLFFLCRCLVCLLSLLHLLLLNFRCLLLISLLPLSSFLLLLFPLLTLLLLPFFSLLSPSLIVLSLLCLPYLIFHPLKPFSTVQLLLLFLLRLISNGQLLLLLLFLLPKRSSSVLLFLPLKPFLSALLPPHLLLKPRQNIICLCVAHLLFLHMHYISVKILSPRFLHNLSIIVPKLFRHSPRKKDCPLSRTRFVWREK